jgi:non-lysosomal glucosylceramidase
MRGASAYTGGLLIAALEAAARMADLQHDRERSDGYRRWCEVARTSFQTKLWNGRYFLFNASDTANRDSIMADQLAGQWYARAVGLPSIAEDEQIRSALATIFLTNVKGFDNGQLGAVNGMRPDGTPDETDMQSQEVWGGVTYALAATMLQEGLDQIAWRTAWGAYNAVWVRYGLWFRTPEAWMKDGRFRASYYMRPQAIWAIEHALRTRRTG